MNDTDALIDNRTVAEVRDELRYHLRYNVAEAAPSLVEACLGAVIAYWDDENDRSIQLKGATWRGNTYAPAHEICEAFKLGDWTWKYDYDVAADERMSR